MSEPKDTNVIDLKQVFSRIWAQGVEATHDEKHQHPEYNTGNSLACVFSNR